MPACPLTGFTCMTESRFDAISRRMESTILSRVIVALESFPIFENAAIMSKKLGANATDCRSEYVPSWCCTTSKKISMQPLNVKDVRTSARIAIVGRSFMIQKYADYIPTPLKSLCVKSPEQTTSSAFYVQTARVLQH